MRAIVMLIVLAAFSMLIASCNVESVAQQAAESEDESPTESPTETPAEPQAEEEESPEATDEPGPADDPEPTSTPEPEPTPTAETEQEPEFGDTDWAERGRLTVLLAGSDDSETRDDSRADAMMVASLDLETGQSVIFGVPRNYADLELPDEVANAMGTEVYTDMLGWLYADAQFHPELAPEGGDPGMVAVKGAIQELLDLHIDYYAMVDMTGFIQLVDAFGGVDINVREPLTVRLESPIEGEGWQQFEIAPGEQKLDGHQALAYARSRTGSNDYDRMERQRCLVTAMTEQADIQTLLTTFPDVADIIRNNLVTDIPLDMLPDMIMLREEVRADQIVTIGFNPPEYLAGRSSEGNNLPATDRIQRTVREALSEPGQFIDTDAEAVDQRHC